jgi:sulfate transport system substrate-binding protein
VFISWENEAFLVVDQFGKDKFEIVAPSVSILAEPPVAVVDKNVERHKTSEVAAAYLKYLYSPEGQEIAAKHHYRPRSKEVAAGHANSFPAVELFTVDEQFGGWAKATKDHFADGAGFDQIYSGGSTK